MKVSDKIMKARSILILDHPFFGCLAMKLEPIECEWCETLCTDGRRLWYNANYVESLPLNAVVGVLAHEVMHCALGHMWRGEGKQHVRWNVATDLTINENLINAGMTMPAGVLLEAQFNGMSAEEIYHKLPEPQQKKKEKGKGKGKGGQGKTGEPGEGSGSDEQNGDEEQNDPNDGDEQRGQSEEDEQEQDKKQKGKSKQEQEKDEEPEEQEEGEQSKDKKQKQGKQDAGGKQQKKTQGPQKNQNGEDPGKCGGVIQAAEGDKAQAEELQAEWKAAVSEAVRAAKGKGNIPGNILIQINEVLDPALPWYVLLRDFVEKCARNDYNWMRPNRRYISDGIILPSLISEELPEIIVVDDTSGSTVGLQGQFAKEVSGVLASYHTRIRLIYCDYTVKTEEEYTTEDLPITIKPIGGGGTSFIPVFEYVAEKGYTPAAMIFLTDLYGDFPAQEPDYPVMWVTPNEEKAPFGMTVKFNVKGEY